MHPPAQNGDEEMHYLRRNVRRPDSQLSRPGNGPPTSLPRAQAVQSTRSRGSDRFAIYINYSQKNFATFFFYFFRRFARIIAMPTVPSSGGLFHHESRPERRDLHEERN